MKYDIRLTIKDPEASPEAIEDELKSELPSSSIIVTVDPTDNDSTYKHKNTDPTLLD